MESHPHAGRVKEKPLLLSSNYIQTGRESLPTNGLLSSCKDIMSKPDVVELCVQKSQGDHVRKLQFMNKKATTHAQVIINICDFQTRSVEHQLFRQVDFLTLLFWQVDISCSSSPQR